MMGSLFNAEKGTWVFLCFFAFFAVIVAVNAIYITTALKTHSGVITEKPYEKGLAYDETLAQARHQPSIEQQASYDDGMLRWVLKDESGKPLAADVSVSFIRPVMDGYDFDITLQDKGNGVYEVSPEFPLKGQWQATLKAQWKTSHYQTRLNLNVK